MALIQGKQIKVNLTGSFTGSFSGAFSGSGANLFDIPASGIVGLNLSQISSGSVSASISPDNGLQVNTNVTATSFTGSLFGTSSFAISASYVQNQILTPTLLDSYLGTRLTPTNTSYNGFDIEKSINGNVGYTVRNLDNTGNGALASIGVQGSGSGYYDGGISLNAVNNGYYVTYLRNTGFLYSSRDVKFIGKTLDFRTGDITSATTRLSISQSLVTIPGTLTVSQGITGSLFGTASWAVSSSQAVTASYAVSASYATTSSYATQFNVANALTASGLHYPTADNGEESFIQTDGNGILSLQYVKTIYEEIINGESTQLVKGTPVYVSGSQGAASIVYRADAGNSSKMPVIYITADTLSPGGSGRGIALGLIKGVDTTGYPAGTEIYIAVGGGWTSTRPTGSAIVQVLGYVTKEGNGGQGVVLNPGPNSLPNLTSGNIWIGNSDSFPTPIPTSSLNVASASYALTASYLDNYVPPFPFTGSAEITGSLTVTGSITATSFTGSLFGTSSYTLNGVSASYAVSSSYTETASYAPAYLPLTGGTINGDIVLNGTASIAFLDVTYQSSSIIYSSGSNQFGDASDDVQTLMGTVIVTGSQQITGSLNVSQGVTGSFTGSFTGDGSQLNNLPISQLIREEFTWTSGSSQTFQLLSSASQVYSVEVQGQGALSSTQYNTTTSSIEILNQLEDNDYITVLYSSGPVASNPYYTQGQVDTLLSSKLDKDFSSLPTASLPLSGSEELAIIQDGETKKVAVSEVGGSGGSSKYEYKNNTAYNHTGTTALTNMLTLTIPANSVSNPSLLEFIVFFHRVSGTNNNIALRVYISNTNDFSTATQFGTTSISTSLNLLKLRRECKVGSGNVLFQLIGTNSSRTDYEVATTTPTEIAIDFTQDVYVFFALVNNSALDESKIQGIFIYER